MKPNFTQCTYAYMGGEAAHGLYKFDSLFVNFQRLITFKKDFYFVIEVGLLEIWKVTDELG